MRTLKRRVSSLQLPSQMTTKLSAYSSAGEKSDVGLTYLKSGCRWDYVPFWRLKEEDPIFCSFELLAEFSSLQEQDWVPHFVAGSQLKATSSSQRPPVSLAYGCLSSSLEPAKVGRSWLTLCISFSSSSVSVSDPARQGSVFKDACDQTGSTWIIQDSLSIFRSLPSITFVKSLCPFATQGNIFTGSRNQDIDVRWPKIPP